MLSGESMHFAIQCCIRVIVSFATNERSDRQEGSVAPTRINNENKKMAPRRQTMSIGINHCLADKTKRVNKDGTSSAATDLRTAPCRLTCTKRHQTDQNPEKRWRTNTNLKRWDGALPTIHENNGGVLLANTIATQHSNPLRSLNQGSSAAVTLFLQKDDALNTGT